MTWAEFRDPDSVKPAFESMAPVRRAAGARPWQGLFDAVLIAGAWLVSWALVILVALGVSRLI